MVRAQTLDSATQCDETQRKISRVDMTIDRYEFCPGRRHSVPQSAPCAARAASLSLQSRRRLGYSTGMIGIRTYVEEQSQMLR